MSSCRETLIDKAVESLNNVAIRSGYGSISEETLAMIVEGYIKKYNPPKVPVGLVRENTFETLVKAIEQPRPDNIVYLDLKRDLK